LSVTASTPILFLCHPKLPPSIRAEIFELLESIDPDLPDLTPVVFSDIRSLWHISNVDFPIFTTKL
jgi:hypothetical protein